ncbi:hypothetical protein ACFQY4_28600 [Catellatospora bangladeshensis]|uniref:hypothetical protein n=1 Tax=Catellatospora bangladeshensis TaxID=310355 RepID=UPI003615D66C
MGVKVPRPHPGGSAHDDRLAHHHVRRQAVADYPNDLGKAKRAGTAWRLEDTDYDDSGEFRERLTALAAEEWADKVEAIVIGNWGGAYESAPPIGLLAELLPRFTSLKALFLGEMTYEECEISWIVHTDITPLLEALPRLETLTVRGASGLGLKPLRHEHLREFTIESGGLPAEVVRAVGECDLPALTHLELWLGTGNYGGDADVDDLAPILNGTRLPALTSLGLRDSEIADQVAAALAGALWWPGCAGWTCRWACSPTRAPPRCWPASR